MKKTKHPGSCLARKVEVPDSSYQPNREELQQEGGCCGGKEHLRMQSEKALVKL